MSCFFFSVDVGATICLVVGDHDGYDGYDGDDDDDDDGGGGGGGGNDGNHNYYDYFCVSRLGLSSRNILFQPS